MNERPLIILTGPTAVGKTKLSIALAKQAGCEIISADSMQVYRKMDIGTAKIKPNEMCGVTHHLIDALSPEERFDVSRFQRMALAAMDEIYARGRIPLIVGGTGFYIQAVLYRVDFSSEEQDDGYRRTLEHIAATEDNGAMTLHGMLANVDPISAEVIHPNNVKRTIRALEYHHYHHRPISEHNESQRKKDSPYRFAYFVLNDRRQRLYDNIDRRVDRMMEDGLMDEVRRLKDMGYSKGLVSMQGLGYKELLACLDGECTPDEAVYAIKRDTRHFAKRQLTWFRRERDVVWLDKERFKYDDTIILEEILKILREKEIL